MPAGARVAAWPGLFTALINGRLSWWHKRSWQQQKPQTVANPSSSHYHRCMRGAILPFLPDLSLGTVGGLDQNMKQLTTGMYINIWLYMNIQQLISCADECVLHLLALDMLAILFFITGATGFDILTGWTRTLHGQCCPKLRANLLHLPRKMFLFIITLITLLLLLLF